MTDEKMLRRLSAEYGGDDDFCVTARHASAALNDRSLLARTPEIRRAVGDILRRSDYRLPFEKLCAALAQTQRQIPGGYTLRSLGSVAPQIAICCLHELYAVAFGESAEEDDGGRYFAEMASHCAYTLRSLENHDYEELLAEVSLTERALSAFDAYRRGESDSRAVWRRNVENYARRQGIAEPDAAARLGEAAGQTPTHRVAAALYPAATFLLMAVCAAGAYAVHRSVALLILTLIPLYELARRVCDRVFGRFLRADPIMRLKLDAIPDDAKTLVLITALLSGEREDAELFDRVERFFLSNRDENLRFGVLADLREASAAIASGDEAVIAHARERISALKYKYGDHFCLFVRRRSYSASLRRYIGWERKRGAVLELCRLVAEGERGEAGFTVVDCDGDFLRGARYLITLDSDTNLTVDTVRELVGAMLHPANRPVVNGGIVTAGHAVLQPRMETGASAAVRTPFTVLLSGSGGLDIYSSAAYETYQTLYGRGIFCGKGIIDIAVYHQLLDSAFPEERVLSHDLLEGSYLRAGFLSNVVLTDSCPKNALSYFTRMHRWIRGDVQAVSFAGRPLTALPVWQLCENLRRALTPVCAAAALLLSPLLLGAGVFPPPFAFSRQTAAETAAFLAAAGYILFPLAVALATSARALPRRFYSAVVPSVWHGLQNCLFEGASLAQSAFVSADAVIRSLWRCCVSHRRMLEWVTASEGDRRAGGGIGSYAVKMLPSLIAGTLLIAFAPSGMYKFTGVLWFLFPFWMYLASRPFGKGEDRIPRHIRRYIEGCAADMWRFFADTVTREENFLPPDNVQFSPTEVTAHRTSPTNVGLYLLSALAARDFGFIDSRELFERLNATVSTVERLPKWHGHLYNWYDTRRGEPIGTPYVSTVDSGNFIASLTALSQGIAGYSGEEPRLISLHGRVEALRAAADFTPLYIASRALFSTGCNVATEKLDPGCYDLYMSESRITSYYAVATRQVPRAHFSRLGRPLTLRDGYLGVLSWSGTMFEYFMPALLLPSGDGSLAAEALAFALRRQRGAQIRHMWGRSESGYYAFDAEMNYQYRAFGVGSLGLKRGIDREAVLAPYATFLVLSSSPRAAAENLRRMADFGLYGQYGFYEAVDFTPSRVGGGYAIIRSYMAHHVGMSLVAAVNCCLGGIFVRRFMSDPVMRSAEELLAERIPTDGTICRMPETNAYGRDGASRNRLPSSLPGAGAEISALLSNGRTRLLLTAGGEISLYDGGSAVTYPCDRSEMYGRRRSDRHLRGMHLYVGVDSRVLDTASQDFEAEGDHAVYSAAIDGLRCRATWAVWGDRGCVSLRLEAEGDFDVITPMLSFEPVLSPVRAHSAHPAFSELSVSAEYIADEHILLYRRRPRGDEKPLCLAVSLEASGGGIEFATRRDILPPLYTAADVEELCRETLPGDEGACVYPFCAVKKTSRTHSGRYRCDFLLAVGGSREEAVGILRRTRVDGRRRGLAETALMTADAVVRSHIRAAALTTSDAAVCGTLTDCVSGVRRVGGCLPTNPVTAERLWRYGISGDEPIISLYVTDGLSSSVGRESSPMRLLGSVIRAHRYLLLCGVRSDLVLSYPKGGGYDNRSREMLFDAVIRQGGELFLGRRIYLVEAEEDDLALINALSCFSVGLRDDTVAAAVCGGGATPPLPLPAGALPPGEGTVRRSERSVPPSAALLDDGFAFGKTAPGEDNRAFPEAPWSYIYAGRRFGTLVTQNSAGFTWFGNSQRRRLTAWSGDPLLDCDGETVIAVIRGREYDLCAVSDSVVYQRGCAVYSGKAASHSFTVRIGCARKLPVKLVTADCPGADALRYYVRPACRLVSTEENGNAILHRCLYGELSGDTIYVVNVGDGAFLLGAYPQGGEKTFAHMLGIFRTREDVEREMQSYGEDVTDTVSVFTTESGDRSLDGIFNFYLPWQVRYPRFFARTGFYQSGGAWGFRDQLQDSTAMVYYDPTAVRTHIIRCAARQYEDGDVMHWWHDISHGGGPNAPHGIRSRCSDDYLWLPYAAAHYAAVSGDMDVFNVRVPYLSSPPLAPGEDERYERGVFTSHRESLYDHCLRALERALSPEMNGAHSLPLIWGGDWNDGMNRVGAAGRGESVWLAFFLRTVLALFAPVCEKRGDSEGAERYLAAASRLGKIVGEAAMTESGAYLRAFYDDGTPLGDGGEGGCAIDLIPQAFSAIAARECGDDDRAAPRRALAVALRRLYDREHKILKIFDPPFDLYGTESGRDPGYIRGYEPGLRENGGQYTHSAVWGAVACFAVGEYNAGYRLLRVINPLCRYPGLATGEGIGRSFYRTEPYALAGDVWANPSHAGRGGWTLYTGAAAWYYRAVVEELLGLKIRGDRFDITPRLCRDFSSFRLDARLGGGIYHIEASAAEVPARTFDGREHNSDFPIDEKEHFIKITVVM